ncbi:MAG: cupredoxin domain-containing protein [Nitrososphaeraceae archaeon]
MNQYQKILSITVIATSIFTYALTFQSIYAQTNNIHSDIDSTPIAAVIMITKDKDGNVIFNPAVTTIKQDEEVLVLNNDTIAHSFTNGANPEDPMAGKMFDSGPIEPKGFIEYVAANLSPGNYTFYTTTDPTVTAQISILAK